MGCGAEARRSEVGRVKNLWHKIGRSRRLLKKAASKAAADESTGGVASGYVEDAFKARTKLADFFSILFV